jgi:hypothetical protein
MFEALKSRHIQFFDLMIGFWFLELNCSGEAEGCRAGRANLKPSRAVFSSHDSTTTRKQPIPLTLQIQYLPPHFSSNRFASHGKLRQGFCEISNWALFSLFPVISH